MSLSLNCSTSSQGMHSCVYPSIEFQWPPPAPKAVTFEDFVIPAGESVGVWPFFDFGVDVSRCRVVGSHSFSRDFTNEQMAFRALCFLVKNIGIFVSRNDIGQFLFGVDYNYKKHAPLVALEIHKLKKLLEPKNFLDRYISSDPLLGYKLKKIRVHLSLGPM